MRISSMLRSVGVGTFTVLATVLALPSASHAQTELFNWTSNHCSATGGCNPGGTITVTQSGNTLSFAISLANSLNFLGGNGAGIGATFTFDLTGISSLTFSPIVDSGQTFAANATTPTSIMMDGAGTFNFGVTCTSCGSGASGPTGGSTLSFSITGTGLSLASLTPVGGAFFAADVVSCLTGTTAGCNGTGNGNTGVIDATLVPGPIVGAGLPGLMMACGGLIALARRRRLKVA